MSAKGWVENESRSTQMIGGFREQQLHQRQQGTTGGEQLNDIAKPHSNDVLSGRGSAANRHVGNSNFRDIVACNKSVYVTLTKREKMMMARSIFQLIRSQDPPGRFLQKDANTNLWFDIGRSRALEKVSQALREKTSKKSPNSSSSDIEPSSSESCDAITQQHNDLNASPTLLELTKSSVESDVCSGIYIPLRLEGKFSHRKKLYHERRGISQQKSSNTAVAADHYSHHSPYQHAFEHQPPSANPIFSSVPTRPRVHSEERPAPLSLTARSVSDESSYRSRRSPTPPSRRSFSQGHLRHHSQNAFPPHVSSSHPYTKRPPQGPYSSGALSSHQTHHPYYSSQKSSPDTYYNHQQREPDVITKKFKAPADSHYQRRNHHRQEVSHATQQTSHQRVSSSQRHSPVQWSGHHHQQQQQQQQQQKQQQSQQHYKIQEQKYYNRDQQQYSYSNREQNRWDDNHQRMRSSPTPLVRNNYYSQHEKGTQHRNQTPTYQTKDQSPEMSHSHNPSDHYPPRPSQSQHHHSHFSHLNENVRNATHIAAQNSENVKYDTQQSRPPLSSRYNLENHKSSCQLQDHETRNHFIPRIRENDLYHHQKVASVITPQSTQEEEKNLTSDQKEDEKENPLGGLAALSRAADLMADKDEVMK